jgi:MOSC domain-containing protein YiiM
VPAFVVSVNVGRPAPPKLGKTTVRSAFRKTPVDGPVAARGTSLSGDAQADRRHHGGAEQAVCAYSSEDAAWWEAELGCELGPKLAAWVDGAAR